MHWHSPGRLLPAEVAAAIDEFKALTEAYEILSDQPTRRQYDRERDRKAASKDAGLGVERAPALGE